MNRNSFISEKFKERSVICNVILSLLLFIPVFVDVIGIGMFFQVVFNGNEFIHYVLCAILEVNAIIALVAAYGFLLKNKRNALAFGLTTLFSFLILLFVLVFAAFSSEFPEENSNDDIGGVVVLSLILSLIVSLLVLAVLILTLLIKKNGKSALSLLESGGVITNVKVETIIVLLSNIALIVAIYMKS